MVFESYHGPKSFHVSMVPKLSQGNGLWVVSLCPEERTFVRCPGVISDSEYS